MLFYEDVQSIGGKYTIYKQNASISDEVHKWVKLINNLQEILIQCQSDGLHG